MTLQALHPQMAAVSRLKCLSKQLYKLPHLSAFFNMPVTRASGALTANDALLVRADCDEGAAVALANRNRIPLVVVRQGAVYFPHLGGRAFPPLSLMVERIHEPYQAARSCLSTALNRRFDQTDVKGAAALTELRAVWSEIGEQIPMPAKALDNALVVLELPMRNQLPCGTPTALAARRIAERALLVCNDSPVVVRSAAAVCGPIESALLARGHMPLREPLRNVELFAHAREVWVWDQHTGLEVLLAGGKLRYFGESFSRAFGVADEDIDHLIPTSETLLKPSETDLSHLARLALLEHTYYADPVQKTPASFHDALDRLRNWGRLRKRHFMPGTVVCLGLPRWKRPILRAHVWSDRVVFAKRMQKNRTGVSVGLQWSYSSGNPGDALAPVNCSRAYMEDGFVRSVGLGAEFRFPLSTIIDKKAMHFDSRHESELESILNGLSLGEAEHRMARRVIDELVSNRITKYNLSEAAKFTSPMAGDARKVVLIAGQVPSDAAVRFGHVGIDDNLSLIRAVREREPRARLLFREHPELVAGTRKGRTDRVAALRICDEFLEDGSIIDNFMRADEIHVVTSLAGFEALLRQKRVVCWGIPFYAGWGLTEDIVVPTRRTRKLSLEELVYGALVLYPQYVDPVFAVPCDITDALAMIRHTVQVGAATKSGHLTERLKTAWRFILMSLERDTPDKWAFGD